MNTPARRESRSFLPDLLDWMESPMSMLRPFTAQPIRVEDFVEDDHYVVRAELPGIDPDKQVEITVANGVLTIRAERQEEHEGKYRSEFRYGAFSRHIPLPATADADDIKATYAKGVLRVTVGLREKAPQEARQIPITKNA
ncbi:MAG TPA: Hsp20/alpha crystallin family protein [Streptosporangiaceae bacterium]|jgi:HSP20 family molecular chaperone IbpA|nr:Hsp20/alpha crystallin family protein [Streptosporangiaceae bacterium]